MFWQGFFAGLLVIPGVLLIALLIFALFFKSEIEARVNYERRRDG